jgi:AraC-like DNA-binding protein
MRSEHPALPVVVITGSDSARAATRTVRLRICNCSSKSVSVDEFEKLVSPIALTRADRLIELASEISVRSNPITISPTACPQSAAGRTAAATAHVKEHFAKKVTLKDVADMCRLSPSQFCRAFRKEHGMSFGEYLLQVRMTEARKHLALPDVLVKEVAYSVGFNDLSYFTRSFKRRFGVSPSAFQARARHIPDPIAKVFPNPF